MDQELYYLVKKAKKGNKDAFADLVRLYKGPVFRQAFAILNDRTEAEDVSQEAFLKAYYSIKKLNSEYAFVSWLSRIVTNLSTDKLKRRGKEKVATQQWINEHAAFSGNWRDPIEDKELELNIRKALQKLSTQHRNIIVLRDVQGFSYEEIAKILKVPVGTVKSRIHAARLALREKLQNRW
ncbi:MAG: hypothetical protein PWQ82_1609 [Thermosediminibacterales bacterium]|nr:hypothetical protein [Thermosediminibacterales bacterium]MDK2836286.1 hypothetical protein [Thermosediminibacterales bacterium]